MTSAVHSTSAIVSGRVLVVDDHPQARASISDVLQQAGHQVDACASAVEALQVLGKESFDLVITDLQMPGMSGLEFIRDLEGRKLGTQVVMITAHATVASAVEAMRHGAFDYLEKPFDADPLEQVVARAIQHGQLLDTHGPLAASDSARPMIGSSVAMRVLRDRIAQVAATSETVLITGESGTGKELVAQSLHAASHRCQAPLISLNCPVLSEHLLESELFGHERGAFTGADAARTGRFELADGGTILLDEVTEIDLPLQAKLLRVLQERNFERVGSGTTLEVDVRVLATTNRDLHAAVTAGRFREDLYFRLAVVPIRVPSLQERREDVPELCRHFLQRAADRLGKEPCVLAADARDLLAEYHWPGNVRELENLITRASVLSQGQAVTADELRDWLIDSGDADSSDQVEGISVGLSLQAMEQKLIEATLEHFEGHRGKTAEALGIGVRTLSGKLKSFGYAPRSLTKAA